MNDGAEASGGKPAAPRSWALPAAGGLILAGVAAFLYVLFAAASKPEPSAGGYARFAEGALAGLTVLEAPPPLPANALTDAAGAETALAAFADRPVLVNLWATWCAPCMEEMPTLGALARRYEGRLAVVAVNLDTVGDAAKAQAELARLTDNTLAFYAEPTRKILWDLQSRGMPTTVLYGADGIERARLSGGADWDSPEAAALIEAVLGES